MRAAAAAESRGFRREQKKRNPAGVGRLAEKGRMKVMGEVLLITLPFRGADEIKAGPPYIHPHHAGRRLRNYKLAASGLRSHPPRYT